MGHSTVMLSTFATLSVNSAKHLAAQRDRPSPRSELTLSEANGVTVEGPISSSGFFCENSLSRPDEGTRI
jgi:hypothetical protein